MEEFEPKTFVETQIDEIGKTIGEEKAVIAVSGGVDSSTCAILTHIAIGDNLICVILDDAFMREGEPERVAEVLSHSPLSLPMKIERVQERFLNALKGLRDAEEKRKAFRETFYRTLGEIAEREGSRYLVQGTILADIIETKGEIKTQHNVLEQIGINTRELYGFKVVEPLASLLKWQVREVARCLNIPSDISERQPFPGPGLSVRVVGEVKPEKLASLKRATSITEENLARERPSQYFAAVIDNKEKYAHPSLKRIQETAANCLGISSEQVSAKVLVDKATGVKGKVRKYGEIVALSCHSDDVKGYPPSLEDLTDLQEKVISVSPSIARVLYAISEKRDRKPYVVAIRAVTTKDFLTADVADIPWSTLEKTADSILRGCLNVSAVYYDVTPKPPATIEME